MTQSANILWCCVWDGHYGNVPLFS